MQITCKSNSGRDLSKKFLSSGYTPKTEFNLHVNNNYNVYGLCVYDDMLYYLIVPTVSSPPSWYPVELFDVYDSSLPMEWYFNYYPNGNRAGVSAIWGYKELVEDEDHYIALIERNRKAMNIFLKRKEELDTL